jgi:hypothetical protein
MVVVVSAGTHWNYADDELCGGATPARIKSEATDDARKREYVL